MKFLLYVIRLFRLAKEQEKKLEPYLSSIKVFSRFKQFFLPELIASYVERKSFFSSFFNIPFSYTPKLFIQIFGLGFLC